MIIQTTMPILLGRKDLAMLELLAKRNIRYGTRIEQMVRLRTLGLAEPHATGRTAPGAWTWKITSAGRAALAAKAICQEHVA